MGENDRDELSRGWNPEVSGVVCTPLRTQVEKEERPRSKIVSRPDLIEPTHLPLVPVEQTVPCVHRRAGRLGHPYLPDDARVGAGDDEQRQEILHGNQVESVDVAEVHAGEVWVQRAAERLQATAA